MTMVDNSKLLNEIIALHCMGPHCKFPHSRLATIITMELSQFYIQLPKPIYDPIGYRQLSYSVLEKTFLQNYFKAKSCCC